MSTEVDRATSHQVKDKQVSFTVPDCALLENTTLSNKNDEETFPVSNYKFKRCHCLTPTKRKRSSPPPQSFYNITDDFNIDKSFSEQEKTFLSSVSNLNYSFFGRIRGWLSKTFSSQHSDSTWL